MPSRCSPAKPAMAVPRCRMGTCPVMQASLASSQAPMPAPNNSVARARMTVDSDWAMTSALAAIRPLPSNMPALCPRRSMNRLAGTLTTTLPRPRMANTRAATEGPRPRSST